MPPPQNRPTWDLTSVLQGVRPDREYFTLSKPGQVQVADNGVTTFEESPDGLHRHLVVSESQKKRIIEALVLLSSQPVTAKNYRPSVS